MTPYHKHLAMLAIATSWGDTRTPEGITLYNYPIKRGGWRDGQENDRHHVLAAIARMIELAGRELARGINGRTIRDVAELVTLYRYTKRMAAEVGNLKGLARSNALAPA